MYNSRISDFGRKQSSQIERMAELFDISPVSKNSGVHFDQSVKGIISHYRTKEMVGKDPDKENRDIECIEYEVTGYDDFLFEKRKIQNLDAVKISVGTIVSATDLLIGNTAKEIKPDTYVDWHGNIFKKLK